MEKVIINHSCEIYNRRTLSPILDKKITYNESFKDKISLKRIFNKNYKQMFPNEKIKIGLVCFIIECTRPYFTIFSFRILQLALQL